MECVQLFYGTTVQRSSKVNTFNMTKYSTVVNTVEVFGVLPSP